jgi:cellulose synthase/poly-beta-1,6-N-acetylglucosamine synthase-like glycosyltransferase
MDVIIETVFWVCIAVIIYAFLGYPFLLFVLARGRGKSVPPRFGLEKTVSLIIAAHDEEESLQAKLENSMALDYPEGKLEIIVASDSSSDRTDAIALAQSHRVRLVRLEKRGGKTAAQNAATVGATGEILVFSDADALYSKDAIRLLVDRFSDPAVGCVCGKMDYRSGDPGSLGSWESLYWKLESRIWKWEDSLAGLILVNGAIYAIRRDLYVPLREELASDLIEPLLIALKGWRIVYEPRAKAVKKQVATASGSLRRKTRVILGGVTSLLRTSDLRALPRNPLLFFQILSHKVLRWGAALAIPVIFACVPFLLHRPFFASIFVLQAGFLLAAALGALLTHFGWRNRVLALPAYIALVSLAAWAALARILAGKNARTWESIRGAGDKKP